MAAAASVSSAGTILMRDGSARTCAFAMFMLLALTLPSAIAELAIDYGEIHRGSAFTVDVKCRNESNKESGLRLEVVRVPVGSTVEFMDGQESARVKPGEEIRATYGISVEEESELGYGTVIFRCYSDGAVSRETVVKYEVVAGPAVGVGTPCLIATATYGSELTPEVQLLRNFRDRDVLQSFAGREGMKVFNLIYYSFSPEVAQAISKNENLRALMRYALYPLIGILWVAHHVYETLAFNPEGAAVATGALTGSMIGLLYALPFYSVALVVSRASRRKLTYAHVSISLVVFAAATVLIAVAEMTRLGLLIQFSTSLLVLTAAVLPGIALSAWALNRH